MKSPWRVGLLALFALGLACSGGRRAPGSEWAQSAALIDESITILDSVIAIPEKAIPQQILQDAAGIAVIPGIVRASLLFGKGSGNGVMSVRRPDGSWSYPSFISLQAHSIGFEWGMQVIDLVLVFKTNQAIAKTIHNELTLGVSASAAAGPVGRYASANTNSQLNSEIYSYARSRGLYLGVALEGSLIRIANGVNAAFYKTRYIPAQKIFQNEVPPEANLDMATRFSDKLKELSEAPPPRR